MIDMSLNIAGIRWKNPIGTASGTFSHRESGQFYDYTKLGSLTTKGVSIEPWSGNDIPRIAETYGGMLNAVGLENSGIDHYLNNDVPEIKNAIGESGTVLIANLAGHSIDEYVSVAKAIDGSSVNMAELNISCPNIENGGIGFGTDPDMAYEVTAAVKAVLRKPLIVKLTPNVTDICVIAESVEKAGADGISLINTLLGMSIDAKTKRPVLANVTGGLSGPAVKPVALRMVYQVARSVEIPVIGMGGIMTGEDAAEFIMAGASAVSVGTAALVDPIAPVRVLEELEAFMKTHGYNDLEEMKIGL